VGSEATLLARMADVAPLGTWLTGLVGTRRPFFSVASQGQILSYERAPGAAPNDAPETHSRP
jgi:hypothetical protein